MKNLGRRNFILSRPEVLDIGDEVLVTILLKSDPNPSSAIMFAQNNTPFFIARAAATRSASMVDIAVGICIPDLKLPGALHMS